MTMHEQVEKWLQEQGYPLEIKVASLFRQSGFSVLQSTYVQDPVSDKSREIDVLANKRISTLQGTVEFTVIVECKAPQKGRPWLLFLADSEDPPLMPEMFWLNQYQIASVDGKQIANVLNRRNLSKLETFSIPNKWSYGMTEALTSGNDRAYSAICSVTSASTALVEKAKSKILSGYRIFEIVIPVIVIDTPILEVSLDKNGDVHVSDADGGSLNYKDTPAMRVHVRSFNSLEGLVRQFSDDASIFLKDVFAQLKPNWDSDSNSLK
jgi:hypothetical protein